MAKLHLFLLTACLLLATASTAEAQNSAVPNQATTSTPETQFLDVANAAAALMKQLMAKPATPAAEAPLQRECAALCQRGRQVTPLYAQWLRRQSKTDLRTAVQHLQASAFVQYLGPLQNDSQFEARYKQSPAAAEMMLELLNALDFERH